MSINLFFVTYFFPIFPFQTSWKYQKTCKFSDIFRRYKKETFFIKTIQIWKFEDSVECCLLRLHETHKALQSSAFFFLLWLCQPYLEYQRIRSKKLFSRPLLIQHTVLEIQFRSLKYTAVIRIRKSMSNFPFLSKRYKAITVCQCKQTTSNSFQVCLYCIYLLKLNDKSIISLTDISANICSEIAKCHWFSELFILTMWKGWRKLKSWVEINVHCIVDQDYQWSVVAVDHSSKFKVI